jgi:endogenous inhibitor of DNA gyrase (YacG/DUF329 family)
MNVAVGFTGVPFMMHARCAHCGGKFGLTRQRWFKNQFCSKRCRAKFLAKLTQDRECVSGWIS